MPNLKKKLWYRKLIEVTKICFYCKTFLNEENRTADHVLPKKRSGTGRKENIEIICDECNNDKGMKTKAEYLKYLITK